MGQFWISSGALFGTILGQFWVNFRAVLRLRPQREGAGDSAITWCGSGRYFIRTADPAPLDPRPAPSPMTRRSPGTGQSQHASCLAANHRSLPALAQPEGDQWREGSGWCWPMSSGEGGARRGPAPCGAEWGEALGGIWGQSGDIWGHWGGAGPSPTPSCDVMATAGGGRENFGAFP